MSRCVGDEASCLSWIIPLIVNRNIHLEDFSRAGANRDGETGGAQLRAPSANHGEVQPSNPGPGPGGARAAGTAPEGLRCRDFSAAVGGRVEYQGLYSDSVVRMISHVSSKVVDILKRPEGSLIVLSGCGTSGRLAYLLSTSFNRLLEGLKKPQVFAYIIAGGDKALLTSQEAPEDSPQLGALNLEQVCAGKKRVLYIGISCGLSAPFVAGQLDLCMSNLNVFTPVLVGCNPAHMARNEPIPGWAMTFRTVVERILELQKTHNAFILNPAVGPEPVSGSSRMKAGSATKILLETLLWSAQTNALTDTYTTHGAVLNLLREYERVHSITYSHSQQMAALVKQAGESLQKRGHIYYVGWHTLGVIGIIDASECVPTFGADFGDIRGFINEGYAEMRNSEGDLTSLGPEFCIGHSDFMGSILPNVTESDTVIFLFTSCDNLDTVEHVAVSVKQRTSNLHAVTHAFGPYTFPDRIKDVFASVLNIAWPRTPEEDRSFFTMFSGHPTELCHGALIRSIYSTDQPTEEMRTAPLTEHAQTANTCNKVVPTALMMLRWGCSVHEARMLLDGHMIIRDAVEACLTA
ncbi:hypothetical protein GJAV_G00001160 [Gymnothorax javanicus]|nr:hypothetical protein GJAV_G00001160 [Gymnothorax javanicus]